MIWTHDLQSHLFEVLHSNRLCEGAGELYGVREDDPLAALHISVQTKLKSFLDAVNSRLNQLALDPLKRKTFRTHLLNMIFKELNVRIDAPGMPQQLTKLNTEYPKDYRKGDRDQIAFIKRQFEELKNAFRNDPDPAARAIEQLQKQYQTLTPGLIKSILQGPRPKVDKPVAAQEVPEKPAEPQPEAAPQNLSGERKIGKSNMTRPEVVADAKKFYDQNQTLIRNKAVLRQALKRYIGNKILNKPGSRNKIVDEIADEVMGVSQTNDQLPGAEKDKALAEKYLSELKLKRIEAGASPRVGEAKLQIEEMIQKAIEKRQGFVKVILTKFDPEDPEITLGFVRNMMREKFGLVPHMNTEKVPGDAHPHGAYIIPFDRSA